MQSDEACARLITQYKDSHKEKSDPKKQNTQSASASGNAKERNSSQDTSITLTVGDNSNVVITSNNGTNNSARTELIVNEKVELEKLIQDVREKAASDTLLSEDQKDEVEMRLLAIENETSKSHPNSVILEKAAKCIKILKGGIEFSSAAVALYSFFERFIR